MWFNLGFGGFCSSLKHFETGCLLFVISSPLVLGCSIDFGDSIFCFCVARGLPTLFSVTFYFSNNLVTIVG